jgi:hypothetical protein
VKSSQDDNSAPYQKSEHWFYSAAPFSTAYLITCYLLYGAVDNSIFQITTVFRMIGLG